MNRVERGRARTNLSPWQGRHLPGFPQILVTTVRFGTATVTAISRPY